MKTVFEVKTSKGERKRITGRALEALRMLRDCEVEEVGYDPASINAALRQKDEPDVEELFSRILAAVQDEFPKFAAEVSLMKYRWEERANGLS
jgi:hypothetical protein